MMTSNGTCRHEANGSSPGTVTPCSGILSKNYPTFVQKYTSCRWCLGYMLVLAFVLVQTIQNSMAFSVVCMTRPTDTSRTDNVNQTLHIFNTSTSVFENDSDIIKDSAAEFDYSSETQGLLISSVFYAAIISPLIGSLASRKFGPKKVIFLGMMLGGVMMMVLPLAARTHVSLALTCRILMGFGVNVVAPASLDFWIHWAPVEEKAQLVSYSFTGFNIANVVVFAVSGFLCLIPIDNGWPFIFYVFGGLTILWCVGWQIMAYETPGSHPSISDEEKTYIKLKGSNISNDVNTKIPWKNIALTKGVWAYCLTLLLHSWNTSILFSYLPSYMATVLKFDVDQNGLLSSLPYVSRVLGTILIGYISVKLLKVLSVTNTRKLIQCGGFFVAAGLAVALCYVQEGQKYAAVAIFTLSTPFQAATVVSSIVTPLDMAPQFASIISAIGMGISVAANMLSPIAVSYIVPDRTREQWTYVFYMNGAIFAFAAVIFLFLGSGELQPWAENAQTLDISASEPPKKESEVNNAYVSHVDELTHM